MANVLISIFALVLAIASFTLANTGHRSAGVLTAVIAIVIAIANFAWSRLRSSW